jgi:hypothetical protein
MFNHFGNEWVSAWLLFNTNWTSVNQNCCMAFNSLGCLLGFLNLKPSKGWYVLAQLDLRIKTLLQNNFKCGLLFRNISSWMGLGVQSPKRSHIRDHDGIRLYGSCRGGTGVSQIKPIHYGLLLRPSFTMLMLFMLIGLTI